MAYTKVSEARRRHSKYKVTHQLKVWHRDHKNDPEYRAKRAAGSRRHLEQLYRDAELGRMTRVVLASFGEALKGIAMLNVVVQSDEEADKKAEAAGKETRHDQSGKKSLGRSA